MKQHGFPKQEKLKKKSDIDLLFKKGKWLSVDNLRIIYLTPNDTATLDSNKTGVSVSKKFFKKAVDRNRLKRLLTMFQKFVDGEANTLPEMLKCTH